jgi:hypothetical protein
MDRRRTPWNVDMRSAIAIAIAFLAVLAPSCTDRVRPSSELGRRFAERLCPIQDTCGCEEELIIPDCEARVAREFLATERRALDAGLELDEACFEENLEHIDALAACTRPAPDPGGLCPVYTAHAEVGGACEIYDFLPWVSECRAGLYCDDGFCRDLINPHLLYEGEICSGTQADRPTTDLGECAEGLYCDSDETRTCLPSPLWPPVPTGGVCTALNCVDESYCHTDDPEGPSEEIPGICTVRTPEGQPCDNLLECTTICTDGICETLPPRMCEALEAWWAREWALMDTTFAVDHGAPTAARP